MEVTEVKVFPVQEDKLKAFVSVVFDNCFMVNDIKVIDGKDGYFISMPSRRKKNGKFKDVAHPLNNDTRKMIEEIILEEYEVVVAEVGPDARRRRPKKAEETPRAAREPERPAEPAKEESTVPPERPEKVERLAAEEREASSDEAAESTEEEQAEKTLEEVTEHHLRDSFWTT